MLQKFRAVVPAVSLFAALLSMAPMVGAQAVSLQEQLAAQYKVVKMGSDTSGYSVVEKGTLLAIQKGGILSVPYGDQQVPANKYENGTIKPPNGLTMMGRKSIMGKFGKEQSTHLIATGDKVYPMKIDVNVQKDTVTLGIVECDTCNKVDPPTYNKASIVFQFPHGSLASASAGGVEDTIGQVLSISTDDAQGGGQGNDQGGQQQGGDQQQQGGGDQAQPAQQQAAAPAAEPASIEKGMTPDQVEGAMGKPEKKVTLGSKVIYYYKDMKVIFLNGKVSDVQ